MDPAAALADLKQISTQIDRAVIVAADGQVESATVVDDGLAGRIAAAGARILEAGERAREDAQRPQLTQLEVSTPAGSVFLVREGSRTIIATTGVEPTVGLIFYDLKSCLRAIAEEDAAPAPAAAPAVAASDAEEADDGS